MKVSKVTKMGHLRISVEDSLHKNLKRRAIDEGIPMRELLVKALEEYVDRNPPLASQTMGNQRNKVRSKSRRRRNSV
jgi:hypothetical protein